MPMLYAVAVAVFIAELSSNLTAVLSCICWYLVFVSCRSCSILLNLSLFAVICIDVAVEIFDAICSCRYAVKLYLINLSCYLPYLYLLLMRYRIRYRAATDWSDIRSIRRDPRRSGPGIRRRARAMRYRTDQTVARDPSVRYPTYLMHCSCSRICSWAVSCCCCYCCIAAVFDWFVCICCCCCYAEFDLCYLYLFDNRNRP